MQEQQPEGVRQKREGRHNPAQTEEERRSRTDIIICDPAPILFLYRLDYALPSSVRRPIFLIRIGNNIRIRNRIVLPALIMQTVRERTTQKEAARMQIITTAIVKGGTGKTTTAAGIAQAAAADKKKVLAIDLDPQGNLTAALAADPQRPGGYELITGGSITESIQESPQGLSVIAAAPNLATIKTKAGSAKRLQQALKPIEGSYDLVLIDTPPQAGELTFLALQASTGLLIPLETDTNSVQGLYFIVDIARQIQKSNPALSFTGIITARYDGRPNINKYLRDTIKEKAAAAGIPYLGEVRAGIAVRESQAMQQSLFEYAPNSKPATDLKAIYKKIMQEG
jgi:chromosome partitioning protein